MEPGDNWWLQLVIPLLSGLAGGSVITTLMAARTNRREQQHAALARVQDRRVEMLPKLWHAAGDVCTPNEIRAKELILEGERVEKCYKGVSAWYREHGILLDPHSRVWTLLLREQMAAWVRANSVPSTDESEPEERQYETLLWDGDDYSWAKIWLIKTALRILLETTLSEPQLRLYGRWHRTWTTKWNWFVRRRLRQQLRLKFQIVDQIAGTERKNKEREGLIEDVLRLASGKPARQIGHSSKEKGATANNDAQ